MAVHNPSLACGRAFALAALLTVITAGAAHAQTVEQVKSAVAAITAQRMVLYTAIQNLGDMGNGENAPVVSSVTGTAYLFDLAAGTVIAVAVTLPHMRDPDDAKQIRIQLQQNMPPMLNVLDVNLKTMNGYMTLIRSPAVRAETTKVRDAMVVIRQQVQSMRTEAQ
jgi:hypothetical protein